MKWSLYQGPIETNVPPPGLKGSRKYQWDELKVGQSFLVYCARDEKRRLWDSLTSCRRNAQARTGFRFEMRGVEKGIRIWRME